MPSLTIYVKDNSYKCGAAIELASRIKKRLPSLELDVINIDRGCDEESIIVKEEPVFVVENEVLHIGNPDEETLIKALAAFDKRHLN